MVLENGADVMVQNAKDESALSLLGNSKYQHLLSILQAHVEAQIQQSSGDHQATLIALLKQIKPITITEESVKKLPGMNKKKTTYFMGQKEKISMLVERGITLEELAAADFAKLKILIQDFKKLDSILKVVTLKQIFDIDHTPPTLTDNFKKDLPRYPDRESGTSGGGDPGQFRFERTPRLVEVTYNRSKKYKVSWTILNGALAETYDNLANKVEQQERYLNLWVELNANDVTLSQLIPLERCGLQLEQGDDDKLKRVYYSPDIKLFHYEKYDADFPIDTLLKDHKPGLDEIPYYLEQCNNQTLIEENYSYEKLRALNGMTENKLLILTKSLGVTFALTKLIPIEELTRVDDVRLDYLITNYWDCVETSLKLVDIREILGFNAQNKKSDKNTSKIVDGASFFAKHTNGSLANDVDRHETMTQHNCPCILQ